ncbi:MAG: hypothetical protein ABL879_13925 [Devosia sp.]
MDWVGLIIQLIGGAVGGYGTGKVAKNMSSGTTVDTIVGLIGGFGGTWLAGMIPGLASMLMGGGAAYAGQAVTGVVGGGILTAIVGAIRKATMKAS